MYHLEVGDRVKVVKQFWFYADFYYEGLVFTIEPQHVMHNFDEFVVKIEEELAYV